MAPSCVSFSPPRLFPSGMTRPKSSSLAVSCRPPRADHDVARLDVAVDQPDGMSFPQCPAHLPQEVDRPVRRERAVPLDELFERQAGQVLHDIVEGAVRCMAVVVDLHGVRMGQCGGGLDLALESPQLLRVPGPVRVNQFDGAGRRSSRCSAR